MSNCVNIANVFFKPCRAVKHFHFCFLFRLQHLLFLLQSPFLTHHVVVHLSSVDMRHMLRWPPLQASCNTTLLYSVQYQGEFELEHQNGRWMEAPGCQRITLSHCDLTSDLGSDSDYNIRVRAHCGSQRSAWTKLSPAFNRRQSKTRADSYVCFTSDVRCVYGCLSSAETYLSGRKRKSDPDAPAWKTPTTLTVTVIITAGLLFVLFWSIVHCRPETCKTHFHKEPLPQSLVSAACGVKDLNQEVTIYISKPNSSSTLALPAGDTLIMIVSTEYLTPKS
uniref:Fibronectin type-III domain-containing protein n=1 Tax=Neolamprologus brichardi TaxID=32507 RepID=A0A3Q4HIR6_NEOBR